MKDDKKKGITIAIVLLVLSIILGFLLSPFLIDYYFSKQPVYSISESREKLNVNKNSSYRNSDTISLGQTIVLRGYLNDNFTLINTGLSSDEYYQQKIIPVLDKINCIPIKAGNYNLAGAYNLNNRFDDELGKFRFYQELNFYVLWILGGCE